MTNPHHFGTIWISPFRLNEMAKNLPQSHGKYNLLDHNCQTWVLSLLRQLNQELNNPISHLDLQKWANSSTIGINTYLIIYLLYTAINYIFDFLS